MRKFYLTGMVIAAVLAMNACTTDGKTVIECTVKGETKKFETTPDRTDCDAIRAALASGQIVSTTGTVVVAPTTPIASTAPNPNNTPPFNVPLVEGKGTTGLVEPTDKAQRQEELSSQVGAVGTQNRDPFTAIPGSIPTPPPVVTVRTVKPPTPPNPSITVKPPIPPNPSIKVTPPSPPSLPAPPSTVEALAVLVSGVLEISGTQYVIINAPGEPTSRAIAVGQKFVNNQVLLKRIDNFSSTPLIILEQNGVEVTRPVGQQPVSALPNPNSTTTPALTNLEENNNAPSGVISPPATNQSNPTFIGEPNPNNFSQPTSNSPNPLNSRSPGRPNPNRQVTPSIQSIPGEAE